MPRLLHLPISSLALFLPIAAANLNYLSPAPNIPEYGVNIPEYGVNTPPSLHARALPPFTPLTFTHGIASGDPHSDTVILWTRAIPPGVDENRHVYSSNSPKACVAWQISATKDFTDIIDGGETVTSGEIDYTVKVDAQGLEPKTHYWYRFGSCGADAENERGWSEVGRTKTLPGKDDPVSEGVKFAVYSCSNYAAGWFNVYGMSARKDSVDYVLHLGDYIYEFPTPTDNPERISRPLKEVISLRDYRLRHATHKTDPDLLMNHRMFPIIPIWDDHELANDGWRSGLASPKWQILELTSWSSRVHNGLRAYFEYLPIRPQPSRTSDHRIWRTLPLGQLGDLVLLDTRYYDRDETNRPDRIDVEDRSIMGRDQEEWLYGEFEKHAESNKTWMILAQQIQFSNINETAITGSRDKPFYYDGWSGYRANRRRVLEALQKNKVRNPVVLTGDYHTLWTADLTWDNMTGYDPVTGEGALGVELAGTAVTSRSGYGETIEYHDAGKVARELVQSNPFLKWAEGYYRGYFELDIRPAELKAVYYSVPNVATRDDKEVKIAEWVVREGEKRLGRPFGDVVEGQVRIEDEEEESAHLEL